MSIEDILHRIAVALEAIAKNSAGLAINGTMITHTGAPTATASGSEPAKRGPGRPPKGKPAEVIEEDVSETVADEPVDIETPAEEVEAPAAPAPKVNTKAIEAQKQTLKLAFKDLLGNKGRDAVVKLLGKYKAAALSGIADKDLMAATVEAKKLAAA